jgi:hypothetical protein
MKKGGINMKVVVGQLAELIWRDSNQNAVWCYCVVERVFDDRIQFLKEDGGRYMHILNKDDKESDIISNQPTQSFLTMLHKGGKPVMAKKRLFGGYKIK